MRTSLPVELVLCGRRWGSAPGAHGLPGDLLFCSTDGGSTVHVTAGDLPPAGAVTQAFRVDILGDPVEVAPARAG